jgi:hypothetical protein
MVQSINQSISVTPVAMDVLWCSTSQPVKGCISSVLGTAGIGPAQCAASCNTAGNQPDPESVWCPGHVTWGNWALRPL